MVMLCLYLSTTEYESMRSVRTTAWANFYFVSKHAFISLLTQPSIIIVANSFNLSN